MENLDSWQLDVLREVGNIGAGNAATALAKMLDRKIDMMVPQIRVMTLGEVGDVLGNADSMVVGIMLGVQGDISGSMMFVLDIDSAQRLANLLMMRPLDSEFDLQDEMSTSALQEIGNILAGSYLSALSALTSLNIMPDVPSLAIDMAGAILAVPAIELSQASDTVIYIENEFKDGEDSVIGDLFLIPDESSYGKLLKALGVL